MDFLLTQENCFLQGDGREPPLNEKCPLFATCEGSEAASLFPPGKNRVPQRATRRPKPRGWSGIAMSRKGKKPCPRGRLVSPRIAFLDGLSTLSAPAVDHDPRAGSVWTKNPVIKIEAFLLLVDRLFHLFLKFSTAFQTKTALRRERGSALIALNAGYFFMAVWTFHIENQLFLEVVTWKGVIICLTLRLLHFGHLNFVFSYSEMDMMRLNFLLHFSHLKS